MRSALLAITLCVTLLAVSAATPVDSLRSHWGPLPAPSDSTRAIPTAPPTPAWKHLVRVPYYVAAVPLTAVDWTARGLIAEAEEAGLFRPSSFLVQGIRDPLGNFWLPTGSLSDDRGLEVGVVAQRPHFPGDYWVTRVSATTSTREAHALTGGMRSRFGDDTWFEVGTGTVREDNVDFHGLGWDSAEEDLSEYRRDIDWIGSSWRQDWTGLATTTLAVMHSTVEALDGDADDDVGELRQVHADLLPPGFASASSGVTAAAKLELDSTTRDGNPADGSRLVLRAERFWSTDDSGAESWTWGGSAEHFLELWWPQRTLAIKAWWLRQEATGSAPIPFTRQLDNGDPHRLRGFGSDRFRATGTTGLTVEYRWPFWILNEPGGAGVDAYLFGDVGQFFDDVSEIRAERLLTSGGLGLRAIGTDGGFVLRTELAVGREGVELRLSGQQMFQFIKAGFYAGSDPLPFVR
ncbi:hypothetical protein GF314_12590 [bacterium]|nr:hypothetical protein [bacterium]